MSIEQSLRALANDRRLQILEWLRNPRAHFPAQVDGDLVKDGVCGLNIAKKLGVTKKQSKDWCNSRSARIAGANDVNAAIDAIEAEIEIVEASAHNGEA